MNNLRRYREDAGLTQAELAVRAGVSRQLVGAAEAGRNLPRVDAAIALAAALHTDVGKLFSTDRPAVDIATGSTPGPGALLMVGGVGDTVVTAPARVGLNGWDAADGIMTDRHVEVFERAAPGFVVAGCEPGLEALERILREHGMAGVAATASSTTAIEALSAGRAHAAVVHGVAVDERADAIDLDVARFTLTRWQVGLAAPPDAPAGWVEDALSGRVPVVQREIGAGVQRAFQARLASAGTVPGPRVASHFEAARRAVLAGMAAVTIEPAALAAGAAFHVLETHDAQLWVDRRWIGDRVAGAALDVISSHRFQRRLLAIGGYDLSGCGTRVA